MCELYPHYQWRRGSTSFPFRCNSWRCPECEPRRRRAVVEICKRWADTLDLTRAATLTLDPARVSAEELAPYMRQGEDAGALMDNCRAWRWRTDKRTKRGRHVMTYAGGEEGERRALRRAFVKLINAVWNRTRTRLKKTYPVQFVRVTELHDDTVRPHLHLLFSMYVPRDVLARMWTDAGGGGNVWIEKVRDVKDAARYMMKYLTKSAKSASPGAWPKGARRIVVSRALSLTLNPEEKKALEEYRARPTDPEGACLGGYTATGLEGCDYAQCAACIWRRRRVCVYTPPGREPCALYDTARGVYVLPLPDTGEREKYIAWVSVARKRAMAKIPPWAHDDARTRSMHWQLFGVPVLEENCIPMTFDPAAELYLYSHTHERRDDA